MQFKYGLNEKPPFLELLVYGVQWLAISIPMIIIVGQVVAGLQFDNPVDRIGYIQKVFFVVGISILLQIIWGHRLPLIIGPASVLLVGIAASSTYSASTIYTSILIGGIILGLFSVTGLFNRLKPLFTSRVIVVILILISFTLTPMILNLILNTSSSPGISSPSPLFNLLFALGYVLLMFIANRFLTGFLKSTLIIWSMLIGSLIYFFIYPPQSGLTTGVAYNPIHGLISNLNMTFHFEPGVLISFIICFIALSINDLGSIESIGELLKADEMPQRLKRGISFTGLLNVVAGFLGVIGPVNYSLSPGVIASTRVATRFALIPTGLALLMLAFLPGAITLLGSIPSVVIGATFIYTLCSQIAAGFGLAFNSMPQFKFEHGLILGLPLMLSIIISFLPSEIVSTFPPSLRPILGNGFVIGVITVMIMEHIIYREPKSTSVTSS